MKKVLTLAALLGAASMSFGQGYVNFANTSTSRVSTNGTTGVIGLTSGGINSFYYALLWAPSTQNTVDPTLSGWTLGATGAAIATVGRMTGNNTTDGTGASVTGTTPAGSDDFVVVGWSANLGTDWNVVFQGRPTALVSGGPNGAASWTNAPGGYFGISAVAQDIPMAPSTGPFNPIFGAAGVPNLTLSWYNVPEPTSMALLGLGTAGLVIFRRRKQ